MKWRNPSQLVKDISKDDLPLLSSQDLNILPFEPEEPTFAAVSQSSQCDKFQASSHFKIPKLPRNIRYGQLQPQTPRTPRRRLPGSGPNTPAWHISMTPKLRELPPITPRAQILRIPCLGDLPPLTPSLFNLISASPNSGGFNVDLLSTPQLFPKLPGAGVPDILSMIDNDNIDTEAVERKVDTFDPWTLRDDNIADYILDVSTDFTQIHEAELQVKRKRKLSVIPSVSVRHPLKKGRGGKKISVELERILKEERRIKYNERRKLKKQKSMMNVEKTEDCEIENVKDTLQRKVKRYGRRTRSLVRACKEVGLATTEADIDAIFTVNRKHDEDEE